MELLGAHQNFDLSVSGLRILLYWDHAEECFGYAIA